MKELVLELVAFFGFLCILLTVLLPVLGFVLRFMLVDVPREWGKWQLHRAQQHELRRLQRRVDALTRRKQTEQETRRRGRVTSAQKLQQTEDDVDERLHPIVDNGRDDFQEERSSKRKAESTPRQQRHRLSIYSTGKKPAREHRRTREHEEW